MAEYLGAPGTTSEYIQPQFSTDTSAAVAGGIQGMLGDNGYLNSVMGNWYDKSVPQGALGGYAQYNAGQAGNFSLGNTTYNPGQAGQFTANTGYNPGAAASYNLGDTGYSASNANPFIGDASYNQGGVDQIMNSYVGDVANEQMRLSNQNLFENILPGVNSTFAGAGQFGSTRNADFTNRAIRDQQYTLAGQLGNTLMNAENQAQALNKDYTQMGINALNSGNQNYQNWTQMGLNANDAATDNYQNWTQMGANAQNQGNQLYTNWNQQALNAQNSALQNYQNWTQMGINAGNQDYANWFQQANWPVGALGTLASAAGAIETNNPLAISNNAASASDLDRFVAAMGAANTAANDGTLDWLSGLMG